MKNVLRWIWSVLEVFIVIYVILITSLILNKNKYGYTEFFGCTLHNVNLIDENNIKNAHKGELLVVKNSNDIEVGDLIYYYVAYNDSYLIRSDYVTKIARDDLSALYTVHRGNDDFSIASERVLGKYANLYPTIGGILEVVESRIGFLFLVLLPIMIVFIYQVYEFIVVLHYEDVTEDDDSDNDKDNKKTTKLEKTKSDKFKFSDNDVEIL